MAPSVRTSSRDPNASALTTALPPDRLATYLDEGLNHPVPLHGNPSDHALDVVNTDFIRNTEEVAGHVQRLEDSWTQYAARYPGVHQLEAASKNEDSPSFTRKGQYVQGFKVGLSRTWYLIVRNWINYSRNLLAYGVRLGMYRE